MTVYAGYRKESDGWMAVSLVIYDDGTSQTWTRRGFESKEKAIEIIDSTMQGLQRALGGLIERKSFDEFIN